MGTGSSQARASQGLVSVGSIVVRCVRFDELLAFWQAALSYVPREPPDDGWVVLDRPDRCWAEHLARPCRRGPPAPARRAQPCASGPFTSDQAAEVERLLGLGATRYERDEGPDDDFVVLVDPDGNRFCVVGKPNTA